MELVKALKKGVRDSGETLYAVAKGSGIDYSVLLRFMADERDILFGTASRLADHLGLELRSKRRSGRKRP